MGDFIWLFLYLRPNSKSRLFTIADQIPVRNESSVSFNNQEFKYNEEGIVKFHIGDVIWLFSNLRSNRLRVNSKSHLFTILDPIPVRNESSVSFNNQEFKSKEEGIVELNMDDVIWLFFYLRPKYNVCK